MKLFTREMTVGIFRGFSEGGLEFHADLVLPYRNEFQSAPMHGQFLVVQLEDEDEAVLGRITSISSEGRLASSAGEDYGIRAVAEDRPIPEDLREQYLKYRVHMRVLGVLRNSGDEVVFAASHRRLPHVGSKVAFLSPDLLREVAGHNIECGAELGHLALGEFIYASGDARIKPEPWMQVKSPCVIPKFRVLDLVARRTLVFARAGFGKSNLVKLLFADLYQATPTVEKRGARQVPVGSVIFDPDGEYFWPDDKNRPGLCDVPALQDKVVVFTPTSGPSLFYQSFVAGDIRLDIRRLRPSDVISIALSPEKQDQQNVRKLKGMNDADWQQIVDLVHRDGNAADGDTMKTLLRLESGQQDAEMVAARANMTTIVRMLHDPSSQMMDMLLAALRDGKLCVIDVSQMRGTPALVLSGLILRRIFDTNQQEFTKAQPQTIPVIAVVEEAQSVLGSAGSSGEGPYISWVKEGRKYDLGAVLITQQPGSISSEILSQGDNWFCFHLLSAGDLKAIKSANAHFSDDILSSLLNEPIPGHGVFWSSAGGKSYPIPIRVLSFEGQYQAQDPHYNKSGIKTAAAELRERFATALASARGAVHLDVPQSGKPTAQPAIPSAPRADDVEADEEQDVLGSYEDAAINAFRSDGQFIEKLRRYGMPWRGVQERLKEALPDVLSDRDKIAYGLVPKAMSGLFGQQDAVWKTEKRRSKSGTGYTTWIVIVQAASGP
jgi:DNA helicase HerA-like ATPase